MFAPPPIAAWPDRLAERAGALLGLWPRLALALGFRLACYAAMSALALWAELRGGGAPLFDLGIAVVPYVDWVADWVARHNTLVWLAAYLPLSVFLLVELPRRWIRYMVTGGLVSLARGCASPSPACPPRTRPGSKDGIRGRSLGEALRGLP